MQKPTPYFLRPRLRFWGLLSAAGVVACAATVFGFMGRWHWFLDLFSHFRLQYFAAQAILGGLFLLIGWRRTATLFLAFACFNLVVLMPSLVRQRDAVPAAGDHLRVMLLNVNTDTGDSVRVRQAVADSDADLVVLQEISPQWLRDLASLTNAYPYTRFSPRDDNFGIALFSRLPLKDSRIEYVGDAAVPTVLAHVTRTGHDVLVIGTHPLPPAGGEYTRWRNDQLEQLPVLVPPGRSCLLLGDLNVTPWHYSFRTLLKRSGLVDSARWSGLQPTWRRNNPLLALPLDHCLHSPDMVVVRREIGNEVGSDHRPVIVEFVVPLREEERRRGAAPT